MKQSKTDPNADAEALFREVRVLNETHGASPSTNVISEYVRLKVFTERGKEFGNVQLPFYFRDASVMDVQGRTIHADGSIVELAKDAVYQKVLEKRGYKTKVVTFAMPAVEPGSIIEYKYRINEGEASSRYRELEVQSAFPVDEVTFFIKPLTSPYFAVPAMRFMPFGCRPDLGQPTHEGFDVLTVKNVPAFHDEPYSLPNYSAKQWILIYYEENSKSKDKYWTSLGKDRYHDYADKIKVTGQMKELAAEITAGAKSDDEKLEKLLEYCRKELKDTRGDEITTAELDKAKENRTTADTIKRKQGTTAEINYAFLALAQAAGFDARRADLSDRSTFLFAPVMQSAFFLNAFDIAVNVGGNWKFYDVTNPAVPGGRLRWQEQGVYALVNDPKEPEMIQTPLLPAQESTRNRMAFFKLSEDGELEGDVREMLGGNIAIAWREENQHTNDTQREEALREELKHRFADFEVSKVKVTASPDASKPVGITYHIVIRNYAQRTGKRLFVEPDYFASGYASRFPEGTRHNNVYFEYPWTELDSVDITVPAGFDLDHADAPQGVNIPGSCNYLVKMGYVKDKNTLQYRRQFVFGDKNLLVFDVKIYPNLKKVFDMIHDADNHMLTFKAEAAMSANQ